MYDYTLSIHLSIYLSTAKKKRKKSILDYTFKPNCSFMRLHAKGIFSKIYMLLFTLSPWYVHAIKYLTLNNAVIHVARVVCLLYIRNSIQACVFKCLQWVNPIKCVNKQVKIHCCWVNKTKLAHSMQMWNCLALAYPLNIMHIELAQDHKQQVNSWYG